MKISLIYYLSIIKSCKNFLTSNLFKELKKYKSRMVHIQCNKNSQKMFIKRVYLYKYIYALKNIVKINLF